MRVIRYNQNHYIPHAPHLQADIIGSAFFSRPAKGRDKIVWSVRFRRARRTSVRRAAKSGAEKAKTLFHLLKESARIPTAFRKSDYTKAVIKKLVFAFSVCAFLADPKSFGVFDFVPQGVQAYVAVRNRAQKKRKRKILCRNPSGFRHINCKYEHTKSRLTQLVFAFSFRTILASPRAFSVGRFFSPPVVQCLQNRFDKHRFI